MICEDYLVGKKVKVLTGRIDQEETFIIGMLMGYVEGKVYAVVEVDTFMEKEINGTKEKICGPGRTVYVPTAKYILVEFFDDEQSL